MNWARLHTSDLSRKDTAKTGMSHALYRILSMFDQAKLHYSLARFLPDAVTIQLTVVGVRYEVNVYESGEVLTSKFSGDESVEEGLAYVEKIVQANFD